MAASPAGPLVVTKDTRISEILDRYGDLAEVIEVLHAAIARTEGGQERSGPTAE